MIWLLDLNFTLVGNSDVRVKPFARQIEGETYRQWLVDMLRGREAMGDVTLLVTARPHHHREQTLASIKEKTGWSPREAYFNTHNEKPPRAKLRALKELILPQWPQSPMDFFGLESNPLTRGMYRAAGIRSVRLPSSPPGNPTAWIESCLNPPGDSTKQLRMFSTTCSGEASPTTT